MPRPNFFCSIDTLNCLLKMDFPEQERFIDLTFDLIEVPFWFLFTTDPENWTMKAYTRGEIYSHEDGGIAAGSVVVNRATGEGQVNANRSLAQNMGAFFQACRNISGYIQREGLEKIYAAFDPESEGILLSAENGVLTHRVVSGKERPEMMCTTLFGGTVMCRPYTEDFMERSMRELLPLAEKIRAAEAGDTEFMDELAQLYLNGSDEVEADPTQTVYWLRRLALEGNSNGMFNLGLHYAKGYGVQRDFRQAAFWMMQAAENGDEDAPALAEKYHKAADAQEKLPSGDAQAQADLAGILMELARSLDQAGPGKDFAEAFELAKKSAAQDNGDGLWILALAYEHGRGVEKDVHKALDCYRRGAKLNHAPSLHSLGCYYMRGDVIEQDQQTGFDLIMRSAEQGYDLAYRSLGACYQFGNGVKEDMLMAIRWFEKYLETNDDPELARKVELFRILHPGEDITDVEEDDGDYIYGDEDDGEAVPAGDIHFTGGHEVPEGLAEVMDLLIFASENGLEEIGTLDVEKHVAFVEQLAREGNEEARMILENYHRTNG